MSSCIPNHVWLSDVGLISSSQVVEINFLSGGPKGLMCTSCGVKIFLRKVSVPINSLYFFNKQIKCSNCTDLVSTKAVGELAFPIMSSGLSCSEILLWRTILVHTQDHTTGLEPSPERKVRVADELGSWGGECRRDRAWPDACHRGQEQQVGSLGHACPAGISHGRRFLSCNYQLPVASWFLRNTLKGVWIYPPCWWTASRATTGTGSYSIIFFTW